MPLPATLQAFAVTRQPLDLSAVIEAVMQDSQAADGTWGGLASFLGVVRRENQGRRVVALEYEAYEPLALRALERIRAEAAAEWPEARLAVHHRIGRLGVGETSVAIAAGSPHRAEAFAACRYAIERVKQIVPIWKRELFEGGAVWIEGATADPENEAARRDALRRACGSQ